MQPAEIGRSRRTARCASLGVLTLPISEGPGVCALAVSGREEGAEADVPPTLVLTLTA